MAVIPESFTRRKPRSSPELLLQSVLLISQHISSLQPLKFLLKRNTSSVIRKSQLITILLEEFIRNDPVSNYSPSFSLCLEELYIVLKKTKALLEDCSVSSKLWLLIRIDSVSNSFHDLTGELSTLFDILPDKELSYNDDVKELVELIKRQCLAEKKAFFDDNDKLLRSKVLTTLDDINHEIIPDYQMLFAIFNELELRDSNSCSEEIECLEEEIQNQSDERFRGEIIALVGLVRYGKCVLYGASTPRIGGRRRKTAGDVNIPVDFRCPISLDLMVDPVVVCTGQTYDSSSIRLWIESGHNTCPKTGQTLAHVDLIPNYALKSLIVMWCREQRIYFQSTETNTNVKKSSNGVVINKTALEATKMTVLFLVNKLIGSQQIDTSNRLVHELRVLAKTESDSRACIAEAGGLPLLVTYLGSDYPNLQVNAVTTILNLSILEANKTRIMETEGVLNGVIEVLRSGATWEAKGNAAAAIFSLTSVHAYRKKLGRKTRVVKGLVELAREGPANSKRDAMVAILNLAGDRESAGKLIESGVVDMISEVMERLPEEAVMILEVVVKKGGLAGVVAAYSLIPKLAVILREGSDRARESVAATLVNMCRKGGSEMVRELAAITGIERTVWEIMGMGTGRGRRKAATLLRILRRWAAGLMENHSASITHPPPPPILLPGL